MANGAIQSPDTKRDTTTMPIVFAIYISFGESGGIDKRAEHTKSPPVCLWEFQASSALC
jgi:hypothetical protein